MNKTARVEQHVVVTRQGGAIEPDAASREFLNFIQRKTNGLIKVLARDQGAFEVWQNNNNKKETK